MSGRNGIARLPATVPMPAAEPVKVAFTVTFATPFTVAFFQMKLVFFGPEAAATSEPSGADLPVAALMALIAAVRNADEPVTYTVVCALAW